MCSLDFGGVPSSPFERINGDGSSCSLSHASCDDRSDDSWIERENNQYCNDHADGATKQLETLDPSLAAALALGLLAPVQIGRDEIWFQLDFHGCSAMVILIV